MLLLADKTESRCKVVDNIVNLGGDPDGLLFRIEGKAFLMRATLRDRLPTSFMSM